MQKLPLKLNCSSKNHKNHNPYKANISKLSSDPIDTSSDSSALEDADNLASNHNEKYLNDIISSCTYVLYNDDSTEDIIEDDATIKALSHYPFTNTLICAVFGVIGHPTIKFYRHARFIFLPSDLQKRITAYNAKYGNTPNNDKVVVPPPNVKPISSVHIFRAYFLTNRIMSFHKCKFLELIAFWWNH